MSVSIKLLRSVTPGKVPTVAELGDGQLFLNMHDGKAFFKKNVLGVESIHEVGEGVTQITANKTITKIEDVTAVIDPSVCSIYRISVIDAPTCAITFSGGVVGVASEATLYVIGEPALSFDGVFLTDRMVGTEKVDGGSTTLGVNFTVFKFLWTGYEWIAYKDVMK